jgi:transposase-like protein
MQNHNTPADGLQAVQENLHAAITADGLNDLVRAGVQQILQQALQAEIQSFLLQYTSVQDEQHHQLVVRNGFLPQRELLTSIGNIPVQQPRVRDKRPKEQRVPFTSKLLPPYLRKTKTIEAFLPFLYLKGISTGDMLPTLQALLGSNAKGLSASVVSRLKEQWKGQYHTWKHRSLAGKEYVYADGIYIEPRGDEAKLCLLVIIGVTRDGVKELVAVEECTRQGEGDVAGNLPFADAGGGDEAGSAFCQDLCIKVLQGNGLFAQGLAATVVVL